MTSLFANQFRSVAPYDLGQLPTGAPSVGARLPGPKEGNNAGEPNGAKVGVGAKAAIAGGAASIAATSAAANAAFDSQQSLRQREQGNITKMNALTHETDANANVPLSSVTDPGPVHVQPQGRVNPAAEPHASDGGFMGFIHRAANFVNQDYNPVYEVMHPKQTLNNALNFGQQLFPSPIGVQKVTGRQSADSGVTEPSAVYRPDGSNAYTSVGTGRAGELPPAVYSPQFSSSFGHEAARAGQAGYQSNPENWDWSKPSNWAKDVQLAEEMP